MSIPPQDSAEQPPQEIRLALVVGVNQSTEMSSVLPSLQAAEKNALTIAQVLQDHCQCEMVLPPLIGEQVKASTLHNALETLAQKRTDETTLIFYFSGHGYLLEDQAQQRQVYLVTHDFSAEEVEEGEDMDAISLGWLQERLYKRTKAGRVLLILDCCYAGNAGCLDQDRPLDTLTELLKNYLGAARDTTKGKYRMTLAATAHDQSAYERDGFGVMTYHILNALRGDDAEVIDTDGQVTLGRLHDALQKRMPAEQKPSLSGDTAGRNIILTTYADWSSPLPQARRETEQQKSWKRLLALCTAPEGERFLQSRLASFVGRHKELEEIHQIITTVQPTGGYVIITGHAGQGKSSIIAKLIASYGAADQEREHIPFHFIRFHPGPDYQVTLLQNLMARLIHKYQISDLYVASDQLPALRDFFLKVLLEVAAKGGREILFIDGLDQLEEDVHGYGVRDLSFLPPEPPAGIVFVLGTRPDDTLSQLKHLHTPLFYALPSLSQDDFRELLQARHVQLQPHLINRFYVRMQKNTLYLDLVAEELYKQGALTTEATETFFQRLINNPSNIFSFSIERLKRHRAEWRTILKPILGILLTAQQPLTLWQLRTILRLESDQLHDGLRRLGGFIDATGQQYSLYHLKLQEFLRHGDEQADSSPLFPPEEEEEYHTKFVHWCGQTSLSLIWQNTKNGNEQSRRLYARHHYITHLYLAHSWEQLFTLLDKHTFGQAKERYDVHTRSYVQDLKKGFLAAASEEWTFEEELAQLPRLWRYTLLRCSLQSTADQYPLEFFRAMLLLDKEREVAGFIELLTQPEQQASVLILLAQHLLKRQESTQEIKAMLLRAEQIASSITDLQKQTSILIKLATVSDQQGNHEWAAHLLARAEQMAFSIAHPQTQAIAFSDLIIALTQKQHWSHAEKVASSIVDPREQATALVDLATALARQGNQEQATHLLTRAEQVASSIVDPREQAMALERLATALARQGNQEQATHLLAQAEQITFSIQHSWEQAMALGRLATALARQGNQEQAARLLAQAEQIASSIAHPAEQAIAFRDLVIALAQQKHWERAERIASSIPWQASALADLVTALARQSNLEQAERIASSIADPLWQAHALVDLATALARQGNQEQAARLLAQVEQIASTTAHPAEQARTLVELTIVLAELELWEQAEQIASSIPDPQIRANALVDLATALARQGNQEQAAHLLAQVEQITSSIADPQIRADALVELTTALAELEHWEQAEQVAFSIQHPWEQAAALGRLTTALIQQKHWEQAEQVAFSIQHPWEQAAALGRLATALAQQGNREQAARLLAQAEQIASSIPDPQMRATALVELTTTLAELKHWEQAEQIASSIAHPWEQAAALGRLATALAQQGNREQAARLLAQAEQIASSIAHPVWQARALSELVITLAQQKHWERAKQIASSIADPRWQASALRDLVKALIQQEQWEQAKQIASSIAHPQTQAMALKTLAWALAREEQNSQLLALVQRSWWMIQTREEALQLLPLAFGLLKHKPDLGLAFYDAFQWVYDFLQPKETSL